MLLQILFWAGLTAASLLTIASVFVAECLRNFPKGPDHDLD